MKILRLAKKIVFGDNLPIIRNIVSILLFSLSIMLLDIGFRSIYRGNLALPISDNVSLYMSIAWTVLFSAIGLLLPRIARRIYLITVAAVYSIFVLVHAFFYSFNNTYLTFSSAIFAGDGAAFFDWSYFYIPKKLIAILLIVIFLAVLSALIIPKTKYNVIGIICIVLVFAACITGVFWIKNENFKEDGPLVWNTTRTPNEIYESFSDPRTCMHMVGLYQYTFKDISNVTGLTDLLDTLKSGSTVSLLDEYYDSKEIDPDNEMTGIFKDKNMIFIQLESIDTWMVNDIAMPFFSDMVKKSINFKNFYAPKFLAASTFNTETIANTGLITPVNSAKTSYFTENYYPYSCANLFKEAGYTVNSFHSSNGGIYNRGRAHTNWGYTKYHSFVEMKMENSDLDTHMMSGYDLMVSDKKFMSFIVTYSGHGPYNGESVEVSTFYDIIKPQLPKDAEEEYIYALCHARETDEFLKALYERLKADGKLEDTVFVMYSDHYDHYITNTNILKKYKGGSDLNLWCNIPFIVYNEGFEPMTVEKTISTFDILPTVVNLFDLNTDGRYYVGNDAFSENGGYAFFSNHSWVEGDTYFNTNGDKPTDLSAKRNEEIGTRLNMNWDTVKTNYFDKKKK